MEMIKDSLETTNGYNTVKFSLTKQEFNKAYRRFDYCSRGVDLPPGFKRRTFVYEDDTGIYTFAGFWCGDLHEQQFTRSDPIYTGTYHFDKVTINSKKNDNIFMDKYGRGIIDHIEYLKEKFIQTYGSKPNAILIDYESAMTLYNLCKDLHTEVAPMDVFATGTLTGLRMHVANHCDIQVYEE